MRTIDYLESVSNGLYNVHEYDSRTEWLKARRSTIGASDAAAVLGLSPWKTEAELWKEKRSTSRVEEVENADTVRGTKSEEHILALYGIEMECSECLRAGTGIILRSVEHPCMSCTLDGILDLGHPIVVEVKSVRRKGGFTDSEVPQHYLVQVLHQLAVTGWQQARLLARFASFTDDGGCFVGGREREYVFDREDYSDQIDRLVRREERFWSENIVGGRRPAVRVPRI